jgi:uncharacterized protein (TIGR03437 family)
MKFACVILAAISAAYAQSPYVASPSRLDITVVQGDTSITSIPISISASGFTVAFGVRVDFAVPGINPWLSVSPATGTPPATIQASFAPAGLAASVYNATITISPGSGGVWLTIPVVLTVLGPGGGGGLKATPAQLQFTAAAGSVASTAAQTISITNPGAAFLSATVKYNGTPGWLALTGASNSNPVVLTATASPRGLTGADYVATIEVAAQGAGPLSIPVALSVLPYVLNVSPAALNFNYVIGDVAPPAQTLSLASTGGALDYTITAAGASWLSFSPSGGKAPGTVTVSVNPAGMTAGKYGGVITVLANNASVTRQDFAVNLTVAQKGSLNVTPATLTFGVAADGSSPPAQTLLIDTGGGPSFPYTATATTVTGGNWLSVTPASSAAPRSATVSVNAAGLGAGSYTGTITISAVGIPGSPATLRVNLTVVTPAPIVDAVTNAATLATGPVAPGEIVTLFGRFMGPTTLVRTQQSAPGFLDKILGGVTVVFDGSPSPLVYVRSDQISAIVPYGAAGQANTQIIVLYKGQTSKALSVPVTDSAPGIFTASASGKGTGAILDGVTYGLIDAAHPAKAGSVVLIYVTGEGRTKPDGEDGKLAQDVLPAPVLPVSVSIAGHDAQVLYTGAAPGLVAGLMQINVVVPDGVTGDALPIVVMVGRNASPAGVTIAVR